MKNDKKEIKITLIIISTIIAIVTFFFSSGQVLAKYKSSIESCSKSIEEIEYKNKNINRRIENLERWRISDTWNTYHICTAVNPPNGCIQPRGKND